MKFINNIIKLSLVGTFLAAATANAGTTTWTWELSAGSGVTTSGASTLSSTSNTVDSKSINADFNAWADTGGIDDTELQTGAFYHYGGGWGVVNQDESSHPSPDHAFDNQAITSASTYTCQTGYDLYWSSYRNKWRCKKGSSRKDATEVAGTTETDYDMALITFDTSVELTEINFGWTYTGNTAFSVLAYTGAGAPASIADSNWGALTGSGWTVVGNYNNNANNGSYYIFDAGGIDSKNWLIGAYNSTFGNTIDDNDIDAFKLKGIKAITSTTEPPTDVPAPAALSLMLIGALGVVARQRKNAKK